MHVFQVSRCFQKHTILPLSPYIAPRSPRIPTRTARDTPDTHRTLTVIKLESFRSSNAPFFPPNSPHTPHYQKYMLSPYNRRILEPTSSLFAPFTVSPPSIYFVELYIEKSNTSYNLAKAGFLQSEKYTNKRLLFHRTVSLVALSFLCTLTPNVSLSKAHHPG